MWHAVPRLDRPNKVWLLPAPVAKWIGMGVLAGPIFAQLGELVAWPQGTAWDHGLTWIVWLAGMAAGVTGAFVRPGGHDLGYWLSAVLNYTATPKRARWRPGGPGGSE